MPDNPWRVARRADATDERWAYVEELVARLDASLRAVHTRVLGPYGALDAIRSALDDFVADMTTDI